LVTFLLDTNVISEVRKGERCDRSVAAWYRSIDDSDLYLSVLVTGEIRRGVERARHRDPDRAAVFERWLENIGSAFAGRILPIDRAVADEWGRLSAIRTVPVPDALLAATASVHGMIVATRHEVHMAGLGVSVLNPFRFAADER
jgi:predicted nucleic acid-binding protein